MKMSLNNKLILTIFLLLDIFVLSVITAKGQANQVDELDYLVTRKRIEFIVAPSLLYPIGSFNTENNPRVLMGGYSLGVGFQKIRSEHFEITYRLLFDKKGYKTEYINIDSVGNKSQVLNTQSLNYFSLNVLPAFLFGKSRNFKLIVGGYVSILIYDSFKQEIFLNDQFVGSYFVKNVKDRFDSYDYGITFGTGYTKEINENLDIGFQLLGNMGLNSIAPNTFRGVVVKLSSISLSVVFTYKQ